MIETKHLSVAYDDEKVLEDISVKITGPAIVGLIGPNGAGKSTFLKALMRLVNYSGLVKINNKENQLLKHEIAYVEQRSQIDLNFPITVKECVALGTYGKLGLFKNPRKKDYEKVKNVLSKVGLEGFKDRPIKALSGGQFQRMLVARCLIQEASYIFLDEPFIGIDSVSETIIMTLLKELKEEGKTILIVHHDLNKVEDYFDHIMLLNKRLIAYGPVETTFTKSHLESAYGQHRLIERGS